MDKYLSEIERLREQLTLYTKKIEELQEQQYIIEDGINKQESIIIDAESRISVLRNNKRIKNVFKAVPGILKGIIRKFKYDLIFVAILVTLGCLVGNAMGVAGIFASIIAGILSVPVAIFAFLIASFIIAINDYEAKYNRIMRNAQIETAKITKTAALAKKEEYTKALKDISEKILEFEDKKLPLTEEINYLLGERDAVLSSTDVEDKINEAYEVTITRKREK